MKTKIKREGGKVWIEGVEKLKWDNWQDCTFIGALAAAMRAIGEDVSYDYLMGVSGAAFRLLFHQPTWCPSSPDATVGFNHGEPAMRALGYTTDWHSAGEDNLDVMMKTREVIVQSINKGHPVVAVDRHTKDWGVIIGFPDGGKEFLCRTYWDQTEEYSQIKNLTWIVLVIGEKGEVPARRESFLRSLRIAVDLANTGNFEKYASGFEAYEKWTSDLLDELKFEKLDEEGLNRITGTNSWCYTSLLDARHAAVNYLRTIVGEFKGESVTYLSEAADLHEKILKKLKDGRKYAPQPWRLKEGEHWTKRMRHTQAGVLKEVLTLERKAVAELEKVLASLQ